MSLFDRVLTQPILNILAFIYNFIGDFGVAIIILTLLVRLCLWPLVKKQLHQTKAMRDIQPELKKIKQKANGNKMLESTMMMELYREKNIKPFSSMLVLLIQFPILIAIFRVIQIFAGSAYNATNGTSPADFIYPFLANFGRIPDLIAGSHLTFLGFIDLTKVAGSYLPALILAVIAAGLQYVQSRQTMPNKNNQKRLRDMFKEAAAGKEIDQSEMMQATTGKMMLFMPIMTFIIALALPGAVVLYYAATSLFAVIQQRFVLNRDESELEKISNEKATRRKNATKRKKDAREAEIVVKKKDIAKEQKSSSGGKTVVRRIKAK